MFQPLEVTEARTIWIDSPTNERLGFQDSSRVQIERDPVSTGDFSEEGEGYKATLLGGMWPDDDELRLLAVGVVPGTPNADVYLGWLVPDAVRMGLVQKEVEGEIDPALEAAIIDHGMGVLRKKVQIMPSWSGQRERVLFIQSGLKLTKPDTIKSAALNREAQPKMSFDMFRIQVDALLIGRGYKASDEWMQQGSGESFNSLHTAHKEGLSPQEFLASYMEKLNGRNETQSQGVPS